MPRVKPNHPVELSDLHHRFLKRRRQSLVLLTKEIQLGHCDVRLQKGRSCAETLVRVEFAKRGECCVRLLRGEVAVKQGFYYAFGEGDKSVLPSRSASVSLDYVVPLVQASRGRYDR